MDIIDRKKRLHKFVKDSIEYIVNDFYNTLKQISVYKLTNKQQKEYFDNQFISLYRIPSGITRNTCNSYFTEKQIDLLFSKLPVNSFEYSSKYSKIYVSYQEMQVLRIDIKRNLQYFADKIYSESEEFKRFYNNADVNRWCEMIKKEKSNYKVSTDKTILKAVNGVEVESEQRITPFITVWPDRIEAGKICIKYKNEGYIPSISWNEVKALSIVIYLKTNIFVFLEECEDSYWDLVTPYVKMSCESYLQTDSLQYKEW